MGIGSNRPFSADMQFIEEITILKRRYIDLGTVQNILEMSNTLHYFLMITEPKLTKQNPKEIKKILDWVEDNLHTIYFFNVEGRVVETDGTRNNKKILKKELDRAFSMLLNALQKAGVYTRANTERTEALGDFSGS